MEQETQQSQSQKKTRNFGTPQQIQARVEKIWAKSQIVEPTQPSIENFKHFMGQQFDEFALEVAKQVREQIKQDLNLIRTVLTKRMKDQIAKANTSGDNELGPEAKGAKDGHGTDVQSV